MPHSQSTSSCRGFDNKLSFIISAFFEGLIRIKNLFFSCSNNAKKSEGLKNWFASGECVRWNKMAK